jgi:hypothetical protein
MSDKLTPNTALQLYCPECKEFSQINRSVFTIWPGTDSVECPECHVSFRIEVAFRRVSAAEEFKAAVLPPHLHSAAPVQVCSVCKRRTWDTTQFLLNCEMVQPDGSVCLGAFKLEEELK